MTESAYFCLKIIQPTSEQKKRKEKKQEEKNTKEGMKKRKKNDYIKIFKLSE